MNDCVYYTPFRGLSCLSITCLPTIERVKHHASLNYGKDGTAHPKMPLHAERRQVSLVSTAGQLSREEGRRDNLGQKGDISEPGTLHWKLLASRESKNIKICLHFLHHFNTQKLVSTPRSSSTISSPALLKRVRWCPSGRVMS